MAILGKQLYKLQHAPEYETLVCELYRDRDQLEMIDHKLVERLYEAYCKVKKFHP